MAFDLESPSDNWNSIFFDTLHEIKVLKYGKS